MDNVLFLLVGVGLGAYYADNVRKLAPITNPDPAKER